MNDSTPDSEDLLFARRPARDIPMRREVLVLPDGHEISLLHHRPDSITGPAILYAHGIQSHPGWFVGSAQALARAGCEVFQVTRRGSGTATRERGDATSAGQLLDDVAAAVRYVLEKTRRKRIALVGVSWGGKLLTAYALRSGRLVGSLTLVAPGIVPRVDVSAVTKLAILASRCLCPGRYFDIPLGDVSLFTDNPAMREYLQNDPHRLRRATARFMFASAMLDRTIARARCALAMPTALILARRDRIIDNAATREVVERLTGGRVRTHVLDSAHTIEFEPDPEGFYGLLCETVAQAGQELV